MSDTPETDAAIKDQSKWMRPFVSTTFDGITYDSPVASLCRKLERERDEAIRQRNETNESSKYAVDYAIRERDEARRQAADAITNYTLMEAKCFRLEHHDQFKS